MIGNENVQKISSVTFLLFPGSCSERFCEGRRRRGVPAGGFDSRHDFIYRVRGLCQTTVATFVNLSIAWSLMYLCLLAMAECRARFNELMITCMLNISGSDFFTRPVYELPDLDGK
jgi:hypothetical protein